MPTTTPHGGIATDNRDASAGSGVGDGAVGDPAISVGAIRHERHRVRVEDRLAELAGVVNAATAAVVELMDEALEHELWSGVGLRSPAHWLSWKAGISTATAGRIADVAARLDELPAMASALAEGSLSLDAAALITRHVPAGFDEAAVALARESTFGHLRAVLPRYEWPEEADPEADELGDPDDSNGSDDSDGSDTTGDSANSSDIGDNGDEDHEPANRSDTGATASGPLGSADADGSTDSSSDRHTDGQRHGTSDRDADGNDDASGDDEHATGADFGFGGGQAGTSTDGDRFGEGPGETARDDDAARISWWWDDRRRFRLSASLPTDEGLVLEAALRAARRDAWQRRHEPDAPPDEDTRSDSDADTASGSGAASGAGTRGHERVHGGPGRAPGGSGRDGDTDPGDPAATAIGDLAGNGHASRRAALNLLAADYLDRGPGGRPLRDRHRILAHLDIGPHGRNQLRGHLGPVLPHRLRHLLTCDSSITPVWESQGAPVAVGRRQRIVPDRLRHLIEDRDAGCVVPGCPIRAGLHIHHIRHWEHGGRTDPDNLVALCARHHRMHHLGDLPIRGNPEVDGIGGLEVRDRWGSIMHAGPITRPPADSDPEAAARRANVRPGGFMPASGERFSVRWAHLPPNEGPPISRR